MPGSNNQVENLSRMTAILSGNWKASVLAQSLWEFFNYELYCTVRDDDDKPNRHRIDGIIDANTIGDVRICISLRRNARREEGLVHELLHANLIPLGYPRFWIDEERGSDKWILAGGITNIADHEAMRPIYLSFGYSADRFLGPSRPLNDLEERVRANFERKASDLLTPVRYSAQVSACLKKHGIKFRAINLASLILKKKEIQTERRS